MTDLIQKLVAQKAKKQVAMPDTGQKSSKDISKDDHPVDIQTAWQTLTDKPLYLLEVEIITGVKQSLGLDTADLGLDPELVEGLAGGYRAKGCQKQTVSCPENFLQTAIGLRTTIPVCSRRKARRCSGTYRSYGAASPATKG